MSRFRDQERFRRRYISKEGRRRRSMISLRLVDGSEGESFTVVGRAAADGTRESDEAEYCSPVGVYARPAPTSVVEAVVGLVGGHPDHPIVMVVLDRRRALVAEAVDGADQDVPVLYTSAVAVRLDGEGVASIGPVDDFDELQPLVMRDEFNALQETVVATNALLRAHEHPVSGGVASASLTLTNIEDPLPAIGTQHLRTK